MDWTNGADRTGPNTRYANMHTTSTKQYVNAGSTKGHGTREMYQPYTNATATAEVSTRKHKVCQANIAFPCLQNLDH